MNQYIEHIDSKHGQWRIIANNDAIIELLLVPPDEQDQIEENPSELTQLAASELQKYFKGVLRRFSVPIDFIEGTPFQKQVWKELSYIEYGQIKSYQDIANAINNPQAVRAVGAANGANPIAIIVPCHRVIGSSGHLVGYASGIELKRALLLMEGSIPKSLFD